MFDISFTEILIVSIVALIVIGPEKLPQVARTIGHLFGRGRRYVASVKNDIHNEIRLEELKNLRTSMQETTQSIQDSVRQEMDQIKTATDSESLTQTPPPTPAEDSNNMESQIDTAASATSPNSEQQALESSEPKNSPLDKENK